MRVDCRRPYSDGHHEEHSYNAVRRSASTAPGNPARSLPYSVAPVESMVARFGRLTSPSEIPGKAGGFMTDRKPLAGGSWCPRLAASPEPADHLQALEFFHIHFRLLEDGTKRSLRNIIGMHGHVSLTSVCMPQNHMGSALPTDHEARPLKPPKGVFGLSFPPPTARSDPVRPT